MSDALTSRSALIGGTALALAAGHIVLLPPSPVLVALAAIAIIALSRVRGLGPLPAALLVVVALPYARGADTFTFDIAGLPIRPHDAATLLGMLLVLPAAVRMRARPGLTGWLVVAFLALGIVAFAVGLASDLPLRDIFRDVRWWVFYGAGLLAILAGVRANDLVRGLLIGTTVFAATVMVAALLPVFEGGLKHQELLYDRGTLRMQFGNSVFLVPAMAFGARRLLRRPGFRSAALLLVPSIAVVLSLTRTSILAGIGVVALVYLVDQWPVLRCLRSERAAARTLARRAGGLAAVGALALVLGVSIDIVGTPPPDTISTSGGTAGEQPIDRILFQDDRSDFDSLSKGRFPSYLNAWAIIRANPVLGAGLGSLVDVDYAYNEARAHAIGKSPGVDNAYLTVGMKAGIPGVAVFALLMLVPLVTALRGRHDVAPWFGPAWLGILVLTMTQAFAASLYGPFGMALLVALPALAARERLAEPGPAVAGGRDATPARTPQASAR